MNDKNLLTDEYLIREVNKGSELAFKQLYDKYKRALFLICMRYSNSREEAEDNLQDGFIQIFKEINKFDSEKGSFYTWASRVMVNINLMANRKKQIEKVDLEDNNTKIMLENDFNVVSNMDYKEIVKHLQKMPIGYRTVFNLYYLEGYNHKEIGELLGISESTSKTQLMKSKVHAKNILINDLEISR